jgi:hypothetical protein
MGKEDMALTNPNELDRELKKFKLDSLLLLIADETKNIYMDGGWKKDVHWIREVGGYTQTFDQVMPIWGLAELSYCAIKNSNDHRSQEPNIEVLYRLNNLLAKETSEKSRGNASRKIDDQAKADIFLGLSQTQFWWQDIVRNRRGIIYNFLRYYLLLNEIPKHFPDFTHPDDDIMEVTGFSIIDFSKLLFACYAWLCGTSSSDINILKNIHEDVRKRNPIITLDNINKCISYFTERYGYYRQGHINNPIFFKPIIKTQTNKLIIANAFIWAKKLYEGIFWILREHYLQKSSRDFTSAFGYYYEKYIEMLFEYYLKRDMFHRINEEGKADWFIYTDKYTLIVEQKSSLMSVGLKKEYPPIEQFDEYLAIFKKACTQLDNTDKSLGKKKSITIKLILHFEKLFFKEPFMKKRLQLSDKNTGKLKRYYLIDTEEFEQLIQELSENPKGFKALLDEKVKFEDNPPPVQYGQDFHHILTHNKKWRKVKFLEKYHDIFDNLVMH